MDKSLGLVQCNFIFDGVQLILPCTSGKRISVIQHRGSYGNEFGKWELLDGDAIGNLSFQEVVAYLQTH